MAWLPDLQHVPNTAFKHLTTTISNLEAKLLPYILTFPSQASNEEDGDGDDDDDDDDEKMDEGSTPKKALSTVWILKVPGVRIYCITCTRPHCFASVTNALADQIVW